MHFDIDPLLFGILVALNLQTSFLSPPVAMSAIYLKGVAPRCGHAHPDLQAAACRSCGSSCCRMVVVYVFPQIALWLPSALYG